MAFNYDSYLRLEKMPTLWCWGCGDGVILKAFIRAVDKLGWSKDDVCVVSGIGCSGRFSSYVDFNTIHTTHGRTVAFATGVKLANPDKHVICVAGDGDGLAIGGNHTIHGCRRNIDMTLIIIQNFIYGLTNSQTSPTTPQGMWTVSQKAGNEILTQHLMGVNLQRLLELHLWHERMLQLQRNWKKFSWKL